MKILVCDDEVLIEKVLVRTFSNQETFVTGVSDGEYAIELIKKVKFDLIILDLLMPRVNGFEVLQFIEENQMQIPTLIMTAFSGFDTQQNNNLEFLKYNFIIGVIKKPFNHIDLTKKQILELYENHIGKV